MARSKVRKKARTIRKAANKEKAARSGRINDYQRWWGQLNELEKGLAEKYDREAAAEAEQTREEQE